MRFFISSFLTFVTVVHSHSIVPQLAQCQVNHVILDEFGDETSLLYVGSTLKLVCVCQPGTLEPFLTKTIFNGFTKTEGTNELTNRYYTTTDGVVTIKVTSELAGTRYWCQNSHHYLIVPDQPLCDPGSEICYNDHCHGAITPCLDSRNDKKVFKQVCVAGERYVRVQADLCRHIQTGSSDTGFFEVAQPSVCPTESKNAGGFITAGGNLIQIGSVRVANDLYPFSIHQIRCHSAVTPTCFLIRQGGQVSKVAVCGRCDKAGDVINATVTHEQLRGGTHFHRKVDPKCRQGKLVCGDGRNYRMFIYLVLSGTKYFIPDDNSLENVPICDWYKQPFTVPSGDSPYIG